MASHTVPAGPGFGRPGDPARIVAIVAAVLAAALVVLVVGGLAAAPTARPDMPSPRPQVAPLPPRP